MEIWGQYFITRKLGAKLLGVDKIEDNYLLNLRDIYGYDEEKLIDAFEEQEYLIEYYETDFQVENNWFLDEGGSGFDYLDRFKNDDYVYSLSEYIIRQLGEMKEKFAKELGFTDYSELCEKSEIVYEEPGDVTWYVTELPDGRWAAWDTFPPIDRVVYFATREEAVAYQQAGMEIAEGE